jgi:TonB family protein
MRLSRTNLLPVIAIIGGGAVGVLVSGTLLFSPRADYVPVAVVSATPAVSPIDAQTGTLAGIVWTGVGNQGLSKVQISVEGTGRGGLSNDEGRMLIPGVPPGEHTVIAELIGYRSVKQTVTFVAGEASDLDIGLVETAVPVRGVVVTLVRGGSNPGVGPTTAAQEPLVYVDGVRMPRGAFEAMNSNDIERVDVLKGDEAVAWYGGEASVGVVKVWLKRAASEPIGPEASSHPVFTPFTVAPSVQNGQEVQRALRDAYPPELAADGIGGTVGVYLFIDEDGTARDHQVERSSGHRALDDAALAVANVIRFSPALNRDQRRAVWVSFPITFQVR